MPSFLYSQSKPETQTSHQRQESLLKALSQFEKIYISRLFSRLSESVNQLFFNNSVPRENDLVVFTRLLSRFDYCLIILCIIRLNVSIMDTIGTYNETFLFVLFRFFTVNVFFCRNIQHAVKCFKLHSYTCVCCVCVCCVCVCCVCVCLEDLIPSNIVLL